METDEPRLIWYPHAGNDFKTPRDLFGEDAFIVYTDCSYANAWSLTNGKSVFLDEHTTDVDGRVMWSVGSGRRNIGVKEIKKVAENPNNLLIARDDRRPFSENEINEMLEWSKQEQGPFAFDAVILKGYQSDGIKWDNLQYLKSGGHLYLSEVDAGLMDPPDSNNPKRVPEAFCEKYDILPVKSKFKGFKAFQKDPRSHYKTP